MESEDIVNNDKYYQKESYNVFDNFSVHGLNIEGIKKYYSIPTNKKYHHMIKLNKDLDEIISKHLKEKEEKKKNYKSNIYSEEQLYEMYSGKAKENKKLSKSLDKKRKSKERSININIPDSNAKKEINTINKKDLKQKILNMNPFISLTNNNNNFRNMNFSKDKFGCSGYNKNISYSLKKFRKKLNLNKKMDLPLIKPRKIIIEYQLTNAAGIMEENKNIGHNHFMGSYYNPENYFVNPKNRTKRNVFGGLFTH